MQELSEQIAQAAEVIRSQWNAAPRAGNHLGHRFGKHRRAYPDRSQNRLCCNSPLSPVHGHRPCRPIGLRPASGHTGGGHGRPLPCLRRLFAPANHFSRACNEGSGAELLIVSNACGGLNPQFRLGDIMVIEDHINLMLGNPLIGANEDCARPAFPGHEPPVQSGTDRPGPGNRPA